MSGNVRVKICGIQHVEDALAAIDAGADLLGLNFVPGSPRLVDIRTAAAICDAVGGSRVERVAVFRDAAWDEIERVLRATEFERIQFHGEETPAEIPMPHLAIKAFRAGPKFSVEDMRAYDTRAYLLDACVPDQRGGTGVMCDWAVAKEAVALGKPIILAGGLAVENVAEAVRQVRPFAVDVSGGVEAAPGKKDHERVRKFIHNAKTSLAG